MKIKQINLKKEIKILYLITDICAIGIGFISITQLLVGGNRMFIAPIIGVSTYFIIRNIWKT